MFVSTWFNEAGERRTVEHNPTGLNGGVTRRVVEMLVKQEAINALPAGQWQSIDHEDVIDVIWRSKNDEARIAEQRKRDKRARLRAKKLGHDLSH
jgi:hypothetical protein